MKFFGNDHSKSVFTRKCIGEAVLSLLKECDIRKLKVLSVVRKAGFSRMTFYKYYATPKEALEDYVHIIISEFLESCKREGHKLHFGYEQVVDALKFFDGFKHFFLTMKEQGLYSILIDSVNEFVTEYMPASHALSQYKRYSIAGSLLNCFMLWEEGGKNDSVEEVAASICAIAAT